MSLDETMRFFFDASLRDWNAEKERLEALMVRFQAAETVRIVGESGGW